MMILNVYFVFCVTLKTVGIYISLFFDSVVYTTYVLYIYFVNDATRSNYKIMCATVLNCSKYVGSQFGSGMYGLDWIYNRNCTLSF